MDAVWRSRINVLMAEKGDRENRTVNAEDVARFVGVTRQAVSEWRSPEGVKTISAKHTAKLCEFFGVNEWQLWKLVTVDSPEGEDEPGQYLPAIEGVAR